MLIEKALMIGMAAASIVVVFRSIPPGLKLAATGRKPWACNICMSFWFTIITTLLSFSFGLLSFEKLWLAVPAYIVCLWLLGQIAVVDFTFDDQAKKKEEEKHGG